ncbi:autotransporter-associated beta strand repeat-containing protein [Fontivita pretiosa]|uniref:autotransporter-associated beta strand repeat-containing protein n=1 Tax=Fontivita pretiosa TaxID=2989684 RepID=UPI003D1658EA
MLKRSSKSGRAGRVGALLAAAVGAVAAGSLANAQTGSFLSVDLNGGYILSQNATNLGWDGTANQPVFSPVLGTSFTWSPWGGTLTQGGDGVQLPMTGGGSPSGNHGGYPTVNAGVSTPISKTFSTGSVASGAITVSIAAGTQAISLNSRDRGTPSGTANFGDMYRDSLFAQRDTALGLGSNPLVITISGLDPNQTYSFTGFAYDPFSSGQMIFGAANPQPYGYTDTGDGFIFMNPPEPLNSSILGPRITWEGPVPPANEYAYSSTFKVTADASGSVTFYEWANGYAGGSQSWTMLGGFQVGTVATSTWNSASSGNWGTGPWIGGAPNAADAVANFGSIAAAQTVNLESGKTVGVLTIASPTPYTFAGSTLTMESAAGQSWINVNGGTSTNVTHVINAPVALNNNTSVRVAPPQSNLVVNGAISGSGALNKFGDGALTLTGNNSYSGVTNIHAGRLIVNGTHSGGGTYTVAGGAVLGGNGTINARVNVYNAGNISPGSNGIGTLTVDQLVFGSVNVSSGSVNLNFELGSSGADRLIVTAPDGLGFAVNANNSNPWTGTVNFNITDIGGMSAGTFTLVDYAGTALTDPLFARFALATSVVSGFSLTLINNTANTSIDLSVSSSAVSTNWTGDVDGNWSVAGNWSGGVPNGVDHSANFGSVASNRYAVTVDSPKTVGTMTFSSTIGYTLSGATITMQASNGAPSIIAGAGSHTIAAPITLNNWLFLTVAGGATLNFTGPVIATPAGRSLNKAGTGVAQFQQINTGTLTVAAGQLRISTKPTANSATGTTRVDALVIDPAARLDLNNNSLIINNGSLATATAQIKTALENGGNFDWLGPGIGSTQANVQNTTAGSFLYGLGVVLNDLAQVGGSGPIYTDFAGVSGLVGTEVLVKFTYFGDADLSGSIDATDYSLIDNGYVNSLSGWINGDFDYSGVIDATDYALIDNAYVNQAGPLAEALIAEHARMFGGEYLAALRAVQAGVIPEPASLGALLGVACSLRRPRRRRADRC